MKTKKGLKYSSGQISVMKSIWEIKSVEFQKAFPKTGNRKLVCILIGYNDLAISKTQSDFNDLFNRVGYSIDEATGSVKDYYSEVSYGQLNLTVDIVGPYTASQNMSYYGANNDSGYDMEPQALVSEAVSLADDDINYADYDNDNDGYVDGVYIIYAGYGEEAGAPEDAIWAHAWSISPLTLDGKVIRKYSCSAELRGNMGSNLTHIGVICHEFGHVLGAPDYYDTDYSGSGGQFCGTGNWDMMASGSWNNDGATPAHHNAFTKVFVYNWANATILNSGSTITLQNSAQNSESFYRFNTSAPDEYFIMENRNQVGFDADIPGEGLIIYHVHSDVLASGNRINAGHPQKMYPVCASSPTDPNSSPASYGNINSAGCPFSGSSNSVLFTDATLPSSKSWDGETTNQPVTNIVFSAIDKSVTLDFMGGDSGDRGDDCTDPVVLVGNSGSKNSVTTGFNNDYSGSCEGGGEDRVYYLSTAVHNGGTVEFWTSGDDYDVVLYATYGSCAGTEIACLNDPDGNVLSWENTTGSDQNIWIFIDGYRGSDGSVTLNWDIIQPSLQGENCDDPFVISGMSGDFNYTTSGYSNDYSSNCGGSAEEVVFYLETPVPDGGALQLWTTEDDYDVILYGRYGNCAGTEIACIDDPDGFMLSWGNTTGMDQNIWIFADGYGGYDGGATLHWNISTSVINPGENCDYPDTITGISGSINYTTTGYLDKFSGSCGSTGEDKIYHLTTSVPDNYTLELWTSGDNYDVILYGRYGSCTGTEIGCTDEPDGAVLTWENTTGDNKDIWIFVDGYAGSDGDAILNWNMFETSTGLSKDRYSDDVVIYPNPASDKVMIELKNRDLSINEITVFSTIGSIVNNLKINDQYLDRIEINVSDFAIGTYILEIQFESGILRKKLEVIR
ncbi:hypothetical protein ES705_18265 [subsurface metagenome]